MDNGNQAEDADKLAVILRVLARDRFDAVGTGNHDARLAREYARDAQKHRIALVRAFPAGDALDALSESLRVKRLRGRDLGVTALPPLPKGEDREAYLNRAASTLRALRPRCDFLILLSQLGLEGDKELARRCAGAGPHLIVGNLEAEALKAPLQVDGATLVPTGPGGVRAGTADIIFPPWGEPRVERVAVVSTHSLFAQPDPETGKLVSEYFARAQKAFLAGIDRVLLRPEMAKGAGDAKQCGTCHAREVAHWQKTKHAQAVDTLIGRERMVPECIQCHSTRFRATGKFDHAARAGGIDCTGCHAKAAEHEASRCAQRSLRTGGVKACLPCHTPTNSPNFNYIGYRAVVDHTGHDAWR